jgi:hypothetical protein
MEMQFGFLILEVIIIKIHHLNPVLNQINTHQKKDGKMKN